MNVWNFIGRLGADCETKQIGDGDLVEFRCAVDSGWGDRKQTTWVTCNYWGKRGVAVAPYLTKGQQVAVSGELTNREYDRKDGGKGYSLEVRVGELTLVGGKQQEKTAPRQEFKVGGNQLPDSRHVDQFFEDDVPF